MKFYSTIKYFQRIRRNTHTDRQPSAHTLGLIIRSLTVHKTRYTLVKYIVHVQMCNKCNIRYQYKYMYIYFTFSSVFGEIIILSMTSQITHEPSANYSKITIMILAGVAYTMHLTSLLPFGLS